jgi:hypothetical protein
MGDMRQGFAEQLLMQENVRVRFKLTIAGQCADADRIGLAPHAAKLGQRIDVDQHRGLRQTKVHCRHQALAAGEKTCVLAVPGLGGQGFVERPRSDISEGCGLHGVVATIPANLMPAR